MSNPGTRDTDYRTTPRPYAGQQLLPLGYQHQKSCSVNNLQIAKHDGRTKKKVLLPPPLPPLPPPPELTSPQRSTASRRWSHAILLVRATLAFKARGRTARYVLGDPHHRCALDHTIDIPIDIAQCRRLHPWHCFVQCSLFILTLLTPFHEIMMKQQVSLVWSIIAGVLFVIDLVLLLSSLEIMSTNCCRIGHRHSHHHCHHHMPWYAAALILVLGLTPVNALRVLLIYWDWMNLSMSMRFILLGVNLFRCLTFGVLHYTFRLFPSLRNVHLHRSSPAASMLFWTRDASVLFLLHHYVVILLVLQLMITEKMLESGAPLSMVASSYWTTMKTFGRSSEAAEAAFPMNEVEETRSWMYCVALTCLLLILVMKYFTMVVAHGEECASTQALHAYLARNGLHVRMMRADLSLRVCHWWMWMMVDNTNNNYGSREPMPSTLKRECELSVRVQILNKLYFLNDTAPFLNVAHSHSVRLRLARTMSVEHFQAGEVVVNKHEPMTTLNFLAQGRLALGTTTYRNDNRQRRANGSRSTCSSIIPRAAAA